MTVGNAAASVVASVVASAASVVNEDAFDEGVFAPCKISWRYRVCFNGVWLEGVHVWREWKGVRVLKMWSVWRVLEAWKERG